MGERLIRASEANPKGLFESHEINWINEELIAPAIPRRPPLLGRWFFRERPVHRQRWLARVPLTARVQATPDLDERMKKQSAARPFCFKDPRFCYTLPAWRRHLGDAAFLCIFRDPAETAESILREKGRARYLESLDLDFTGALEVWTSMYEHVLAHAQDGDWLFLHFEQLLGGKGVDRIEALLGVIADKSFPEEKLHRSRARAELPARTSQLYRELCSRAGIEPS